MNHRLKVSMTTIVVFTSIILLALFTGTGLTTSDTSHSGALYTSWNDAANLLASRPQSIKRVLLFSKSKRVVLERAKEPSMVVNNPDYPILLQSLKVHRIPYLITQGEGYDTEIDYGLLILFIVAVPLIIHLYRTNAFEKIQSRLPGAETIAPVGDTSFEPCRFDEIAGCDEAIAKLKRVAKWLKSPLWYDRLGAKIPKGIIAVGPPGTGRTLLARALATEVDANFFSVNGSSFVEMFVGVGARRVRKLFENAKRARQRNGRPSIIFIDEIDAVGKKRGSVGSGSDSEREQTLNQLLVSMQGFEHSSGIIVMAATNRADTLDEALTRPGRFDYRVNVDLPDRFGREKIFAIHTQNLNLDRAIILKELAIRTPMFSGADIEQVCNEAAILAAERFEKLHEAEEIHFEPNTEDLVITNSDFDSGIDYVQFGDPLLSRARSQTLEDRRNVAIHEAGHCAVQQALRNVGADPITKVTIEPRTKSMGSMQSHPSEERYGHSEEELLARIMTALGGRVAQEHILHKKDTGAANDFEQANRIARKMVTKFGMSKLGPIYLETDADSHGDSISPNLQDKIDRETIDILERCYSQVWSIVREHELKISRIADALMDEQTILGSRFLELWSQSP